MTEEERDEQFYRDTESVAHPKLNDHRPKWIAPYLKGPSDAPLIGGDKVTVVTAHPATPSS